LMFRVVPCTCPFLTRSDNHPAAPRVMRTTCTRPATLRSEDNNGAVAPGQQSSSGASGAPLCPPRKMFMIGRCRSRSPEPQEAGILKSLSAVRLNRSRRPQWPDPTVPPDSGLCTCRDG
jgi:hypothetical protein